jgi:hypothetical protein
MKKVFGPVAFFWIGVILTLIFFGFEIPVLSGFQIQYSLPGSKVDWLTAFSTLAAVIVSLTIAVAGKSMKNLFYKSNIEYIDKLQNIQTTQGHTRLLFKNMGNDTAREVEIYVTEIIDNGQKRADFLPVPLSWTHDGRSRRNFHPNQFGYLDLCRLDDVSANSLNPKLVLSAGAGVPNYEVITEGETEISLMMFQQSGQLKIFQANVFWERGNPYVNVVSLSGQDVI